MKEYKHAVFIGRFQPFHNEHLKVIDQGLEIADKVHVIIGSAFSARTLKNPFTYSEREMMIYDTVTEARHHVWCYPARDYHWSMDTWLANVQSLLSPSIYEGESVALLGAYKDSSSFYLNCFPQWDFTPSSTVGAIHSTDLRRSLYEAAGRMMVDYEGKFATPPALPPIISNNVPEYVEDFLNLFLGTKQYANLADAWAQNEAYKQMWANSPFTPTFITADAVVTCAGHVLVIKRKFNPGKGLFALPGGFVKNNETIRTAALRELKEETGIKVSKLILDSNIVGERVFDYPERSERGRTVTHGFHIKLKDGSLPEVRGQDDAKAAMWMPLWDVMKNEDKFFEDHVNIIQSFMGA